MTVDQHLRAAACIGDEVHYGLQDDASLEWLQSMAQAAAHHAREAMRVMREAKRGKD